MQRDGNDAIRIEYQAQESSVRSHRFRHEAMATSFEIIISHPDRTYAEQAAEEAFDELDRLEHELSRYIESSDIARVNAAFVDIPMRIGLETFECLLNCQRIAEATGGAFDVSVGPLLACWCDENGSARIPDAEELVEARRRIGSHLFALQEAGHTITLTEPVELDLGGFGKGYAVDKMAETLRDWGVESALVHGGCSSVVVLDPPPGSDGWPVTIALPCVTGETSNELLLQRCALGSSGLNRGLHIVDPRSGEPVRERRAVWCRVANASLADALSTAFMVMDRVEIENYCSTHTDVSAIVVSEAGETHRIRDRIQRYGEWHGPPGT